MFLVGGLQAQNFQFYKDLIDVELGPEKVTAKLKRQGYEVKELNTEDDCIIYKLERDSTGIVFSTCIDIDYTFVSINMIERDLEDSYKLLEQAKKDKQLSMTMQPFNESTSFLFMQEDDFKEIYFVHNHDFEMYVMELSNFYSFEDKKDQFEAHFEFDPETNLLANFKNILNQRNSKGQTVEEMMEAFSIEDDFNVLELDKAFKYLEEFRSSEMYQEVIDKLKTEFFAEKAYKEAILKYLIAMEMHAMKEQYHNPMLETIMGKIAIETDKFKTLLVLEEITKQFR